MSRLALVSCVLFVAPAFALGAENSTEPARYEEARAHFGTGADAEVKLALWCEAHGLSAERMKHLARAVLADPNNRTARGLLGLVADEKGRWRQPEAAAEHARADAKLAAALAEYNARRERTPETPDAQWKLAVWCEQHGLKPESIAHFSTVIRLAPRRTDAWKRLGFKLHGGKWMTATQIAEESTEKSTQEKADRDWHARLLRIKGHLSYKDPARRAQAESAFAAITDPRAVPALMSVFGTKDAQSVRISLQILSQIDAPSSSRALADLALGAPTEGTRRAAVEILRRRDPRDFVDRFIARLDEPITFHVKPVGLPGQPGEILVEGAQANYDRVYTPPAPVNVPVTPGSAIGFDANGFAVLSLASAVPSQFVFSPMQMPLVSQVLASVRGRDLPNSPQRPFADAVATSLGPDSGLAAVAFANRGAVPFGAAPGTPAQTAIPIGKMVAEVEHATYELRAQQKEDVQSLNLRNAAIRKANDPIVADLKDVLGWSAGSKRSDWEHWWNDQRGYVLASRSLSSISTVFEQVTPDYTPQPIDNYRYDPRIGYYRPPTDCFAAGTEVRTFQGPRAIETIKVGDRVLAQDPTTGSLSYEPVVVVHKNPPSATIRLTFNGETVITTAIQRFWKARHGWVMARDLIEGDTVRTLGGLARVDAVAAGTHQPVFNLEVAAARDFFVAKAGLLVHDHGQVDPVAHPFDGESTPDAASARSGK